MDKKGQVFIQPQFNEADSFSNGMARVKVDEDEHYIDVMGDFMW
ncbi:MAG: WG repeat-containing protein [Nostoc sp.]